MNILIQYHTPHQPLGEFITELMQKRVGQGYPDEIAITINGQATVAYSWTDGIHSYTSIFVAFSSEEIQEIALVDEQTRNPDPPIGEAGLKLV